MEIPTTYLEKFKSSPSKIRNERQDILRQFLEELNIDNPKPMSAGFIALRMSQSGLKTNQHLYEFLAMCRRASHFRKYWWWALKVNNKQHGI